MDKKTVYIAGAITGVTKYWEAFEKAEDELVAIECIPLTPTRLPRGMAKAQYMRICFAMIDSADAVYFIPGWADSEGARLEQKYCEYIGKPHVFCINHLEEVFDL